MDIRKMVINDYDEVYALWMESMKGLPLTGSSALVAEASLETRIRRPFLLKTEKAADCFL